MAFTMMSRKALLEHEKVMFKIFSVKINPQDLKLCLSYNLN